MSSKLPIQARTIVFTLVSIHTVGLAAGLIAACGGLGNSTSDN